MASITNLSIELLELILVNIPPRDLLVNCIRVNKTWLNLMTSSPALQSATWLKSRSKDPKTPSMEPEITFNPLLTSSFPSWLTPAPRISPSDWDIIYGNLQDPPDPGNMDSSTSRFLALPWNVNKHVWKRPEASWRRMQITAPAIQSFEITKSHFTEDGELIEMGSIKTPDGLRMGMLYDEIWRSVTRGVSDRPSFKIIVRKVWKGEVREAMLSVEFRSAMSCTPHREKSLARFKSGGFQELDYETDKINLT